CSTSPHVRVLPRLSLSRGGAALAAPVVLLRSLRCLRRCRWRRSRGWGPAARGILSSRSPPPRSSLGASCAPCISQIGSDLMELLDAIRRRKTTNGAFLPDPVSQEHQRVLLEAAGRAPSQLNSQPWRFVVIEARETIDEIARISGESMTEAMSNGTFFERYKPYFRFSQAEMDATRSGMLFDKLPAPLRPFTGQVFTKRGQRLMNTLGVPKTLGGENRKLVAGSPLLLGVMLDRSEYRPGELSSFYSVFSMGAAM